LTPLLFLTLFYLCNAVTLPYTLEYRGEYGGDASNINGTAKAQTEHINSLISAHGNPTTDVSRAIGSISLWYFNETVDANNDVTHEGYFTFGVHTNHEDHTISYKGFGSFDNSTSCCSLAMTITGGDGTLSNATGKITAAFCNDDTDPTQFSGWVSGYIVLPSQH